MKNAKRAGITTVLLDLDGVVRHFDPGRVLAIERRFALSDGVLHRTAFETELIELVITGRMSRSEWVRAVGQRVGQVDAALEAFDDIGFVDQTMLGEVDALRRQGVSVSVLTNGTDTIPAETDALGLASRFDAIFNSADFGVAKPDPRIFEIVCCRLGVRPADVLFTDDSPRKLAGAIELGMMARQFVGIDAFVEHLSEAGLR